MPHGREHDYPGPATLEEIAELIGILYQQHQTLLTIVQGLISDVETLYKRIVQENATI